MEIFTKFAIGAPATIFALGVIVFVHEFGHFIVAKLFGVRVHVLSLGFGKRLWGFDLGGTDYRVSLLPLGGYVQMAGVQPEESTGAPGDFHCKPRWQRILVYLAGPAMNVVLAVAVIAGVFMVGHEAQGMQGVPPEIGRVAEGYPAELAGLQPGDLVLTVDGEVVKTWSDFVFIVGTSPEKTLRLDVEREGERIQLTLVPSKDEREQGILGALPKFELRLSAIVQGTPAHRAGLKPGDTVRALDGESISDAAAFVAKVQPRAGDEIVLTVERDGRLQDFELVPAVVEGKGQIGVLLGIYSPLPPLEAIRASIQFNIDIVKKTGQVLGKLFTRKVSAKSTLSGPVDIAVMSTEAALLGPKQLIFLMGFLSISIGLMNLLPIPILDGGHISILLAESLIRRDLSARVKEGFNQVGFVLLMMLMAAVIFWDLSKNLPGLFGGG
ncbi:MAG: RIP metalloprotease RseP [Thermoanaerobaculia bacterium]|nr:RIP metalloprotease RseP [Thermoanaerobaculia bacterium]